MKPLKDFPPEAWKNYKVFYTDSAIGYGIWMAPNKTYARLFARGELNPCHKITKIEEVTA